MTAGDITAPGMEPPGCGDRALGPTAAQPLLGLCEDVFHSVTHKLRDRRTPLGGQRSQSKQLLFRQLHLGTNHTCMMASL